MNSIPIYIPQQEGGGGIKIPVYAPQGGGAIPVYYPQLGGRRQRGGGMGIGRRFRSIGGFLKAPMERAKEVIVDAAASTAQGVLKDALNGKDLKQALQERTTDAAIELKQRAEQEASKMLSLKRTLNPLGNGPVKKKKKKRPRKSLVKINSDLFQ